MSSAATYAKLFVIVMGIVGVSIVILTWYAQNSAVGFVKVSEDAKDDKGQDLNQKSFDRSMTIMSGLGVALVTASITAMIIGGASGFDKIGVDGGYRLYMGSAALIAIAVLILASISLSLLVPSDAEKENGDPGTEETPNNAAGFLITMIVLSSVALVAGGGWAVSGPLMNSISGAKQVGSATEFGFDFEF
jgi:hypothetical protein